MQFQTLEEITRDLDVEHSVGEEIAPGVTVTRRSFVALGLGGLASAGLAGCSSTRASLDATDGLTIEQFAARIRPDARRMIESDRPDEAAYLAKVASLLGELRPEEPWYDRDPGESGIAMHMAAWVAPLIVYQIELRPNAVIALHDHRHYNGVIVCREGSLRCQNFDIVQPDGASLDVAAGEVPPSGEDFLIRRNRDATLRPGDVTSLARDRDNIHHVEAGPDGCLVTDVFTHFNPQARSYGIDWDEQPLERGGDVFRVSWKS